VPRHKAVGSEDVLRRMNVNKKQLD